MIIIKETKLGMMPIKIKVSDNNKMLQNIVTGKYSEQFNANIETIVETDITIAEYDSMKKELADLEAWFVYYDRQSQEYARCQRLGIAFLNDNDLSILQLDELAERNKKRINELRGILGV